MCEDLDIWRTCLVAHDGRAEWKKTVRHTWLVTEMLFSCYATRLSIGAQFNVCFMYYSNSNPTLSDIPCSATRGIKLCLCKTSGVEIQLEVLQRSNRICRWRTLWEFWIAVGPNVHYHLGAYGGYVFPDGLFERNQCKIGQGMEKETYPFQSRVVIIICAGCKPIDTMFAESTSTRSSEGYQSSLISDGHARKICTVNYNSQRCLWIDNSIDRARLVSIVDSLEIFCIRRKKFDILLLCIRYEGEETWERHQSKVFRRKRYQPKTTPGTVGTTARIRKVP